ncbi:MAG: lipopolysaccharide biosynthesis protein [Saprospiraceae bacterium]|nr:lipopolysaccharide biosynthesis protein [Saprospiraceae bacterium]
MANNLKQRAVNSTVWSFANQLLAKGISFFVQILLARLLLPEDFGLIAMVVVFINILNALSDSGMASSLLRTKNANEEDYNTVFISNFGFSIVFYAILFLLAPLIANFYNEAQLTTITRIYGTIIVIQSFSTIQRAKLTRQLEFKKLTFVELPAVLISGLVGVVAALQGLGVWALVFMHVSLRIMDAFLFWFTTRWKPKLKIHKEKFMQHFDYGIKMSLTTVTNQVFAESYNLFIGKFYSAGTLGLYNRSYTLQNTPTLVVGRSLNRVTFPMFSDIQDDNPRLKKYYKQIAAFVMLIMGPFTLISFFTAEQLIPALLGAQWKEAIPIFKVVIFLSLMLPIISFNLNIIKAKGLSGLVLKINTGLKILAILLIILVLKKGIMWLVAVQVFLKFLELATNSHFAGKLINYSLFNQLFDLIKTLSFSIFAGTFSYFLITKVHLDSSFTFIAVYVSLFMIVYISLLEVSNQPDYVALKHLVWNKIKK